MPPRDFEFDLHVDAAQGLPALSDAVAAEVIRHVGYAADAATELGTSIAAALAEVCDPGGGCVVKFRAAAGSLEVIVSAGPQATRRIVRPLP